MEFNERKGEDNRNLNISVTLHPDPATWDLLSRIYNQGRKIMSGVNEMRQELSEANAATNELAADVEELLTKVKAGVLSQEEADEITSALTSLKTRLQGVAASYPVPDVPPVDPPIDPNDPLASRRQKRPGQV